jgi:3-oxoadipate enol-lactonase
VAPAARWGIIGGNSGLTPAFSVGTLSQSNDLKSGEDLMRAAVNGIDIEYHLEGPEEAPAVMLSSSLATTMEMWRHQHAAFAREFRVVRYDMRGHGRTGAPQGPYSMEMLADDVVGLLDHLGIETVGFVGLSIGGMIGQALAIHHRRRLWAVALCSTTSQISDQVRAVMDQRIAAVEREGMESQVAGTLERWFTPAYRESSAKALAWVAEMIRRTPVAGYVGCVRAIQSLAVADQLDKIRTPTLVLPAEQDPAMPPSVSEPIHRAIPGSEFTIIKNASHLSAVERPAEFNDVVLRFLREHA